ncbi:MAG: diguanylate cyclase [Armatimonadetes bacterium]|nr:diguanylate cyclase [Armatimonadota bacterium]
MKGITYRNKILLTITGLIVGTLGIALLILTVITQRQAESTATSTVQRTSRALDSAINEFSNRLLVETSLLADRQGTRNVYQADERTINDHLQELKGTADVDWIALTDSQGEVLGSTDTAPLKPGTDAAKSSLISSALDRKPKGGLYLDQQKVSVAAAYPIVIGQYVQATLVLGRRLDRQLLENITGLSGGEAVLSYNGRVVVSTIDMSSFHNGELTTNGEKYIARSQPVAVLTNGADAKLTLSSLVKESNVTGPFQPLKTTLWVLLLLGCSLGVGAGIYLSGSLSGPIERLVSSFRVLERGHWPEPIASARQDEIGVLQHAFDEMTTSIRTSRERLVRMLDVDPLTELLNYRSFRRSLESLLAEEPTRKWVALFDLDQFEAYNQAHGTQAGDELLVQVSDILRDEANDGSPLSRYSGNQFALCDEDSTPFLAEAVRNRIERELPITVSVGLCEINDSTNRVETALLAAEMAVSQAKNSGRNKVKIFEGFSFEGNEESLSFLRQSSYAAVKALAEAVDAKDEYTRGHSQRVAEYARSLAEACGSESGFVDLVFLTGTLHDVGKIGVPDAALKKPGRLTDEEFEMIKLHPALGEKIVRQIPELADALPGIRGHHERWDGRGYPDELAGETIPLVARILAIADTYDAMTSDRPYRKGLSVETALNAIEEGAGTQFDPDLAKVFVEAFRKLHGLAS